MLIHIAGNDVQVGALLRQRCAWCGTILIDYDLTRVAVPVGQDAEPATWPVGDLIAVDGPVSYVVEHRDGHVLPSESCTLVKAA